MGTIIMVGVDRWWKYSDKSGRVVMTIDVIIMVIGDGRSDSGYRGWGE